jgi:hypothetical protein
MKAGGARDGLRMALGAVPHPDSLTASSVIAHTIPRRPRTDGGATLSSEK